MKKINFLLHNFILLLYNKLKIYYEIDLYIIYIY